MPHIKIKFGFLFVLNLFLSINYIGAQWSGDPSINTPVAIVPLDQELSVSISDGNGGIIIAWPDFRDGVSYDIFVQRINSAGVVQWTTNGINMCSVPFYQLAPSMVPDGSGGAIIAWADERDSGNYDIYAQHVDSAGNMLWPQNGVPVCTMSGIQHYPQLITNSDGTIITWSDTRSTVLDIYAQKLDSSGAILWGLGGEIICDIGGEQNFPVITSDLNGGAIISWVDSRYGGGVADIYAQHIDSSGTVTWADGGIIICDLASYQTDPIIISDGYGGAIIAWNDNREVSGDLIYLQRVHPFGFNLWGYGGNPVCIWNGIRANPVMVSDGNHGAVIVWEDRRMGEVDIYAEHFNEWGERMWAEDGVPICAAPGSQTTLTIDPDGFGGAFVSWQDYRSLSEYDLYAQHINNNGTTQWTADGVLIAGATGDQMNPGIVSDAHGGAIIAFEDNRNEFTTYWDIYAQRVDANGNLNIGIEEFDNDETTIFPNPASNILYFRSTITGLQQVQLSNTMGEVMWTQQINMISDKEFSVDLSGFSAGIYFLQIENEIHKIVKQ
jgi:hypothetical protein